MTQISVGNAKPLLRLCMDANVPAMVWGPPGVGKSQIVGQIAAERGIGFVDLRLSQMDPVDLSGLPRVEGERTKWSIPDMLPNPERDGDEGILMLDEVSSCAKAMQAAAYQLILDRKVGAYTLPPGWRIVAAGNRTSDRGVVVEMATPLANRFAHFEVIPDPREWKEWALDAGLATEVVAFVAFRPELLHQFDPASGEKAFPTPRSWEMSDRVFKAMPDDLPPALEIPAFAACVGQAAAIEFTGFLRYFRTMPSIEQALIEPDKTELPDEAATKYAMAVELARRATADNFDRVYAYVSRMPGDFTVLTMTMAVKKKGGDALKQTRAFVKFCVEHEDVI